MKAKLFFLVSAVLILSFFMLRLIPIGKKGVSVLFQESGKQIEIFRPRYLFPREIFFEGFPLPGGGFGVTSDPHFAVTPIGHTRLQFVDGKFNTISVRGVDINPAFQTNALKEQIIAVVVDEALIELPVIGIKDETIAWVSRIFILGLTSEGKELIFFLSLKNGRYLILAPWPLDGSPVHAYSQHDQQIWQQIVSRLPSIIGLENQREQFCDSGWLPVINFWRSELQRTCE